MRPGDNALRFNMTEREVYCYSIGVCGAKLPAIPRRTLSARKGESLRDAELRWQSKADPAIAAHVAAGRSKAECAARAGVSKTAIIGALRRFAAAPKKRRSPSVGRPRNDKKSGGAR